MGRLIAAPTELSGCVLWLDAMDLTSIAKDGSNLVSAWNDKSGNANHAVQATGANQPTYSAAGFGGNPCIDWGDGAVAARQMVTPGMTYGVFTTFLVLKGLANLGYAYTHEATSGSNREYLVSDANPHMLVRRGAGPVSARQITPLSTNTSGTLFLRDSTRHVVTWQFDGSHSGHTLRCDGHTEQAATYTTNNGSPGTATNSGVVYIGGNETLVNPWRGLIAEVVVFSRVLSAGEIDLVEQYLSKKWTIAPRRLIGSPLEIPDCAMWLDAAVGVTIDGSSLVSQWNDQSGNARNVTQGTGSRQPLKVASALNGLPAIRFDGVDDFMSASFTLAQPVTVFILYKSVTIGAASSHDVVFDGNTNAAMTLFSQSTPTVLMYAGASGPTIGRRIADGVYARVTCTFNGAFSVLRVNGTIEAAGNVGAGTPGGVFLGAGLQSAGVGTRWANVEIAEFLVFARRLTDGEIAQVEAYLRRKCSL
jgi:hypothetical protein